jgi:hypothetical protein
MRLKSAFGWFAAGRETEEALQLLSGSAFRLFMWICLRADRSAGSLPLDATQLARVPRKGTQEILRSVDELTHVGVCRLIHDRIVIQERFWPYERTVADPDAGGSAFVSAIKHAFLSHACVASVFTAADERLATDWERQHISIAIVERAIVLGVARKYTALLNNGTGTPITSLEYFSGILPEVERAPVSQEYWAHVARKVRTLEAEYRKRQPENRSAQETK